MGLVDFVELVDDVDEHFDDIQRHLLIVDADNEPHELIQYHRQVIDDDGDVHCV